MQPLLEIVVVTYNSWKTAEQELRQFCALANSFPEVQWCFVDNSPGALDQWQISRLVAGLANVRLKSLPNPGFAAACNTAVNDSDARWCFLLNPDIILGAEQLSSILDDLSRRRLNSTVAVSMVTQGTVHAGIVLLPGWWFSDGPIHGRRRVLGPSGGAGLYPVRDFLRCGGMLESLFAWGEDADLAWRLSRAGFACDVLDLRLKHQGGHSVSSAVGTRFKVRLLYRNRLIVARRNLSPASFALFCLIYFAAVALLSPRNMSRGALGASWQGFGDGVRAIPTTERLTWRLLT